MTFAPGSEGIEVFYDAPNGTEYKGIIKFACEDYVSLCIRTYPMPKEVAVNARCALNEVCIIVYKNYWDRITPINARHKGHD